MLPVRERQLEGKNLFLAGKALRISMRRLKLPADLGGLALNPSTSVEGRVGCSQGSRVRKRGTAHRLERSGPLNWTPALRRFAR